MSEENVEVVRDAFDAWNRGDRDSWLAAWDEDGEFYPLRSQVEGRPYRGHEGLRQFWVEIGAVWAGARLSMDEIRDAGDRFVALGRLTAGGRAGGAELDVPLGIVGAVRNGKVVYARFFSDPAEALEAAGLRE
jgi:ketosteroid isomerase-like protein